MYNIIVTLLAEKPRELNRFLSSYYNKDMQIEEGAFRWTSIFQKPLDSICMLATLVDNIEDYKIEALVSIKHYNSVKVTNENINELVKLLYWMNY